MVYSWLLCFVTEYSPTCTICHCEKYRNFILFSGMEILLKDFQANTAETVCFYKISTRENLVKIRYFMQHIVLQNENIAENYFSTPLRTEYGDLRSKSPYSVRKQENTTRKTPNTDTFYALICSYLFEMVASVKLSLLDSGC